MRIFYNYVVSVCILSGDQMVFMVLFTALISTQQLDDHDVSTGLLLLQVQ